LKGKRAKDRACIGRVVEGTSKSGVGAVSSNQESKGPILTKLNRRPRNDWCLRKKKKRPGEWGERKRGRKRKKSRGKSGRSRISDMHGIKKKPKIRSAKGDLSFETTVKWKRGPGNTNP